MSAHDPAEGEDGEKPVDPRQAMIEQVANQNNEDRLGDGPVVDGLIPAAPAVDEEGDEGPQATDGFTSEPMHPEEEPGVEPLPDEYADDPLAEFIVMDGDKPMFRTVFEGEERFIPLENAQRELQKQVAGDIRLQQNAEWQKNLEAREEQLRQQEVALRAKLQDEPLGSPPSDQSSDVDDAALDEEAREVVSGLFSGSEEDAAAKLAAFVRKSRGALTPAVDSEALAARAVTVAREQITAADREKDAKRGYKAFGESYPEIINDPQLFRFADGMTDTVAEEHPDWAPSEVMLEAGKRTRGWVESFKTPEPSEVAPDNDRQDRKRNLRPMPRPRQGIQETEPEAPPETGADIIASIRESRGQAG
jgi:hypothetical protein